VKNVDDKIGSAAWMLGRSLGSAARLVRQLVPRRRFFGGGSDAAESGSVALREYERTRRRLNLEISQLEVEIERLHSMITTSGVPMRGEGGTASLDELLDQSRQKRDLSHEKRQELARVERHISRERRLSPLEPPEVKRRRVEAAARRRSTDRERQSSARSSTGRGASRAAVAKAVEGGSFGNRAQRLAFTRVTERLLDKDPDVRRDAVLELGRLGGANVPELLLSAVEDPSERVRLAALNALVGSNHSESAEAFRRYLHDKNPAVRLSALRGLASLNARLLPNADLIARLEDSDAAIRRTSANILGWRRDGVIGREVIHALALTLHDDDDDVRAAAAEALGNLGHHQGILSLINALEDPSAQVKEAADRALRSVLGEPFDRVGEGASGTARVTALKEWWKEARTDVYLASHVGELPIEGVRGSPAAAPPTRVAEPPAAPAPAKKAASAAKPTERSAKVAAVAKPESAPDAKAGAAAQAVAAEKGAEQAVEAAEEPGDESSEDFESVLAGGEESAEQPEAAEAAKEAEGGEEAESEGEEGAFEDIFGGGEE
jgi:HEAT repeat protein